MTETTYRGVSFGLHFQGVSVQKGQDKSLARARSRELTSCEEEIKWGNRVRPEALKACPQ